jgi:hypothetical protein
LRAALALAIALGACRRGEHSDHSSYSAQQIEKLEAEVVMLQTALEACQTAKTTPRDVPASAAAPVPAPPVDPTAPAELPPPRVLSSDPTFLNAVEQSGLDGCVTFVAELERLARCPNLPAYGVAQIRDGITKMRESIQVNVSKHERAKLDAECRANVEQLKVAFEALGDCK